MYTKWFFSFSFINFLDIKKLDGQEHLGELKLYSQNISHKFLDFCKTLIVQEQQLSSQWVQYNVYRLQFGY